MKLLAWIKSNVFDWSSEPPRRGHRPPEHDPGWANRQRAKKRKTKKARKNVR